MFIYLSNRLVSFRIKRVLRWRELIRSKWNPSKTLLRKQMCNTSEEVWNELYVYLLSTIAIWLMNLLWTASFSYNLHSWIQWPVLNHHAEQYFFFVKKILSQVIFAYHTLSYRDRTIILPGNISYHVILEHTTTVFFNKSNSHIFVFQNLIKFIWRNWNSLNSWSI